MSLRRFITYLSLMSFLELVTDLLADPAAKQSFESDPQGWLDERGFGDLSPSELDRAMSHSSDALAPDVARSLGPNPSLDTAAQLDMDAAGISLDRPGIDETVEVDLDAEDAEDAEDAGTDFAEDTEDEFDLDADADEVAETGFDEEPDFSSATDDSELLDTASPSFDEFDQLDAGTEPASLDDDYETEFDTEPDDLDDPLAGLD